MGFPQVSEKIYKQVVREFKKDPEAYMMNKNAQVILENPFFAQALNNLCSHFETYEDQVVARIGILAVYDLAAQSAKDQEQGIPHITRGSIDALIPSLKDSDEWKHTESEQLGDVYFERINTENPSVAKTLEQLIPPKDPDGTGKNALMLGGILTYFLIAGQIDADKLKREIAL